MKKAIRYSIKYSTRYSIKYFRALYESTRLYTVLALYTFLLYTPLQAHIYDYTRKDEKGVQEGTIIKEYNGTDGKTMQVYNGSTQKIYVRIGYINYDGAECGGGCKWNGFILNPGQTGTAYKYYFCYPVNISGLFITKDGQKIADIPNRIKDTWINDRGTLRWEITDEKGIEYKGSEIIPGVWKKVSETYSSPPC